MVVEGTKGRSKVARSQVKLFPQPSQDLGPGAGDQPVSKVDVSGVVRPTHLCVQVFSQEVASGSLSSLTHSGGGILSSAVKRSIPNIPPKR